jgi:hypothetical protein
MQASGVPPPVGSRRVRPAPSPLALFLVFAGVNLANYIFHWPNLFQFEHFPFGDPGSNLYLHKMISSGLTPTIDFSYSYGLLGALFGDVWFGLFGLHPYAFAGVGLLYCLCMSHGFALFCRELRLGWLPAMALAVLMPFSVTPSQATITYCLEAVAILYGLAFQSQGRLAEALGMATIGALVKPSLSYVFGAILVALILWNLNQDGKARIPAEWWSQFQFAVGAASLGIAALVLRYGWQPLLSTLFPVTGRADYRARHHGFFTGVGRDFWIPAGARAGYYLGTVAGFWVLATLTLLAGSIWLLASGPRTRREIFQTGLTATALHLTFVTVFFAHPWSWSYYSYVIAIGLTALVTMSRKSRFAIASLCAVAAIGYYTETRETAIQWRRSQPASAQMGLWMTASQREDWSHALELARNHRVLALSVAGWPSLLEPAIQTPSRWFTQPALINPRERQSTAEAIRQANVILIHDSPYVMPIRDLPEFREDLSRFERTEQRTLYTVLVRRITPFP